MDYQLFLIIFSLGMAVPATIVVFITMFVKITQGDNFSTNMLVLSLVYVIALLGWAMFISIMLGGE